MVLNLFVLFVFIMCAYRHCSSTEPRQKIILMDT